MHTVFARKTLPLRRTLLLGLIATVALGTGAFAHDFSHGSLRVLHPWARATAPGAVAGGAYLKIENRGGADRLVAVSSPVAEAVELHRMAMAGDVMTMQKLTTGIDLPAGKTQELKPGGLHIMFIGLKAPFRQGEKFPLSLRFEKAGELRVEVVVDAMTAGMGGHAH